MKSKVIFAFAAAVSVAILASCPAPIEPGKLALLQDLEAPKIIVTSPKDYREYATII